MATTPSAEDVEGRQLVPPLPTLQASELGRRLTASAFHDIRRLASVLSHVNLDSRREDLLDYIRPNRARFLKAYTIISWLSGNHGHGELVVNAGRALAEARAQREQIDTVRNEQMQAGYVINLPAGIPSLLACKQEKLKFASQWLNIRQHLRTAVGELLLCCCSCSCCCC